MQGLAWARCPSHKSLALFYALLQMVALQSALAFADRPLMLVAQQRVPPVQTEQERYDPNIDLLTPLMRYLKELRKVEVVGYSPQHPSVQRFASEKKLAPEALQSPDVPLLMQIGRALGATYVLIARCTRQKESGQLEYEVAVWQPGRRAPLWRTEGNQQAMTRDSAFDTALQSLARTIALRLDTELWKDLPSVPETPSEANQPRPAIPPVNPSEPSDPAKLIKEGRLNEALPLLRAAVNQNPLDATTRLQLIELYQQLGLKDAALEECERALHLMREQERFVLLWTQLMREAGRTADAIRMLQNALQAGGSLTLALTLFDLQLLSGDFAGAEATLAILHPSNTPEVHWRAYLMQGVKRQFNAERELFPLTCARLPALLFVVNGIMNDLANALLDLKRLASDPAPDWKALRERGEQVVVQALELGAWLGRLQPDEPSHDAYTHLQFGAHLMAQSAQQMARYLVFRKVEDLENATLLRAEALRELEDATRASESCK